MNIKDWNIKVAHTNVGLLVPHVFYLLCSHISFTFLILEGERVLEDEGNKILEPTNFSPMKIIPEKIAITAPKERTK